MPQVAPNYDVLAALRRRLSPSNFQSRMETADDPMRAQEATRAVPSLYDWMQSQRAGQRVDEADAAQREEVDAIRGAQTGARMRGFETPQEEAGYGRETERMKIAAPIEAAKQSAVAGMDRLLAQQSAQDARTAAQIESREDVAGAGREAREELASRAVPYQMTKSLQDARQAYQGSWMPDWFPGVGGRKERYLGELTNVLRRTGSLDMITEAARQTIAEGKSADEALAEAEAAGVTLDPDEMEAFRLFVEQFSSQGR